MAKFPLVVTGGEIVTATKVFVGDIAIENGKIAAIDTNLADFGAEVIDASRKYLLPGGIDVHTHLSLACGDIISSDDFVSGTIAAACGGTTTIIDYTAHATGQSLAGAAALRRSQADSLAVIDYGLHIVITDVNDRIMAEIPEMIAQGYPSFKLFTAYDNMRVDDEALMMVLNQTKNHGGLACVHAENHHMINYMVKKLVAAGKIAPQYHGMSRPVLAEAEAVGRVIKLAAFLDAPIYIVHLSCRESLVEVLRARANGHQVLAETCPQYLLLSDACYNQPGFLGAKYVMSPPLRPAQNQPVLWEGLAQGVLQVVATDHCPFNFKGQKDLGQDIFTRIPNGIPGIETRMALIYSSGVKQGRISLNQFAAVTATYPAKIFGLYPQKGTIAIGSDADIVIFDPKLEKTITQEILNENVDYTPYEGFKVTGYPVMTIARGQIIAKDGKFTGQPGAGRFLKRKAPVFI